MLHARYVLDDCRYALELLDDEHDPRRFRVLWAAACALLRAVGHVLKNRDAGECEDTARAADKAYSRWKDDRASNTIFWDFIEEERNVVLKEGRHRYGDSDTVLAYTDPSSGNLTAEVLPEDVYKPMLQGPFKTCDCRELVREGIEWWDRELAAIERS